MTAETPTYAEAPTPAEAPTSTDAPAPVSVPPAAAPLVVTGYTPEVAAMLAEPDIHWWIGTRIEVTRRGAVRLRPDGPDLGLHDHASFPSGERLRVLEDAERPRIVTNDRDVRLLLYVARQDARSIVVRAAPMRPAPESSLGDPPRRGHVILQPGAWVDVEELEGTLAKVAYSELEGVMPGWIDIDALGTTATIVDRPPDERPGHVTKRPTKLLTRPGGKTLVELDVDATVVELGPRLQSGHRLVEYQHPCDDDLVYVGFVRDRDLHRPNFGFGHGCGFVASNVPKLFGEVESAPRVVIEAGRFLLDTEQPIVVGCMRERTEVAALGDGRYAVATIWGPITVRLAPEGFEGRCGG